MKKKQAAKVHYNKKMSGFWTLNCSQTFKTTWIDLKNLPHKLEENTQIIQQVFIEFGYWMQKL